MNGLTRNTTRRKRAARDQRGRSTRSGLQSSQSVRSIGRHRQGARRGRERVRQQELGWAKPTDPPIAASPIWSPNFRCQFKPGSRLIQCGATLGFAGPPARPFTVFVLGPSKYALFGLQHMQVRACTYAIVCTVYYICSSFFFFCFFFKMLPPHQG